MNPEMSIRLMSVIEMIPPGAKRVIDVGSDHGKLAVWCLLNNKAQKAVCTDIHKDPAMRTQRALADHLLSERSEVYCTDGLKGVELHKGDVVVMAGLGGNNIIDIMKAAFELTDDDVMHEVTFVLQAQKSIERLRKYLASTGLEIEDEEVCIDRDIFYQMMRCSYSGRSYTLSLREIYYGPKLLAKARQGEEIVKAFHKHLDDIYKIRARGDREIRQMLQSE